MLHLTPQLMKQYIQLSGRIQCSYVPCVNISRVFAAKQPLPFVFSVFAFVARISLVDDLNGIAPIPAGRDSPLPLQGSPVNVVICNSICVYHVEVSWSYMPGGDHSSPGRVRKPVGPLGPPSPSGVLPTPASCVGQLFGVRSAQG